MRIVFDTNVILSAFLTDGVCSKLLIRARKRDFYLFTSPFILKEVDRSLKKKFSASASEIKDVLVILAEATYGIVETPQTVSRVCRDIDDDHILACALEAKAHYLVTGDTDLLILKRYQKIKIITPRDFEMLFGE